MDIKCEFIVIDSKKYICLVTSAEITKRNSRIEAFDGKHLSGKTNEDVEEILFVRTKVEYFPRGLVNIFPNLKYVLILSCTLKELTKRDLIGLEDLNMLYLPNNHLESLPSNLLNNMKNLTHISFKSNKLKFIDSRMFGHIKHQLVKLDLGNNPKIDAFYNQKDLTTKGATKTIDELLRIVDEKFPHSRVEHNFQKNFCENWKQLWSSERYSDFVVIADKKKFNVHKSVLGIQSPVFDAMFENDMEESKSGKMTINDSSADAVEEFLKFLYTGEIPDETNAMEIFALASKYNVKALKLEMEKTVVINIDSENAIEILKLGNLYDSELMKKEAFDEVDLTYPELQLSDQMKNKPEYIEKMFGAKRKRDQIIEESQNEYKNDYKEAIKKPRTTVQHFFQET